MAIDKYYRRLEDYIFNRIKQYELRINKYELNEGIQILVDMNYDPDNSILTEDQLDQLDDHILYMLRSREDWSCMLSDMKTLVKRWGYEFEHNRLLELLIAADIVEYLKDNIEDLSEHELDSIMELTQLGNYYCEWVFKDSITKHESDLIYKKFINRGSRIQDLKGNSQQVYEYFKDLHELLASIMVNVGDSEWANNWIRITRRLDRSIKQLVDVTPLIQAYLAQLKDYNVERIRRIK
jgi:hypothetical protein